jgi:uncharacterized integral membrane protein
MAAGRLMKSSRILSWIVTAPIALLVVDFAVSNLDRVTLHIWPLPFDLTIVIPLLMLLVLFVGFVLGAIVTWIGDRRRRREARLLSRRVAELEGMLAASRQQAADLERKLGELRAPPPLPGALSAGALPAAALPASMPARERNGVTAPAGR